MGQGIDPDHPNIGPLILVAVVIAFLVILAFAA